MIQLINVGGVFTLNWHHSTFELPFNEIYSDIIKYLKQNNAEFLTYNEIFMRFIDRKKIIDLLRYDEKNRILYIPEQLNNSQIFKLKIFPEQIKVKVY